MVVSDPLVLVVIVVVFVELFCLYLSGRIPQTELKLKCSARSLVKPSLGYFLLADWLTMCVHYT